MEKPNISVSVIIVTFNVLELLKECLESITSKNLKLEIIVIDNGNDDTYQFFKNKKQYTYIKNKENIGFAKANNIGFKIAKGKYILVLNPDTKLKKNTIDTMFNFMEENLNVGMSTCKLLLPDGSLDRSCRRSIPNIKNSIGKFFYLSKIFPQFSGYNIRENINKTIEVEAISGAFMFIRSKALYGDSTHKKIGFFDEIFWAMGEDLDLCKRFQIAKWKIIYYPKTTTLHYKGASGGIKKSSKDKTNADSKTKKRWIKAYFNAMELFYEKYYRERNSVITNYITIITIRLLLILRMIKFMFTKS
ncbi:glycosyltransferase family 2 protein [Patescibacteria group bacterium]|nr:glycosyltransferase family 2 protein [Patescibacteria group bacterium]